MAERDYEALLHPIIDPLVEKPESIMIRASREAMTRT